MSGQRGFWRFLADEEAGSATIWNLFWLLGFCALLGLGVDTTAAMNAKARLQSVADASSHAGVMDVFPVSRDAVSTALAYAAENRIERGAVLWTDVTLGYWDAEAAAFRTQQTPYLNAVRVVARRDAERANALATAMLKVVGFRSWDIAAVSTSTYAGDMSMVDRCRKNGLFAGGKLMLTANNEITGSYCIHGETGFRITQNNLITCGVEMSTGSASGWLSQSVPTPSGTDVPCNTGYAGLSNNQMVAQVFRYRSRVNRARLEYETVRRMLDAFVAGDLDNDPFNAVPPYLTGTASLPAQAFNALAAQGQLRPGTLYQVRCGAGGAGAVVEPQGLLRNIGIYTDCAIRVRQGAMAGSGGKDTGGPGGPGGPGDAKKLDGTAAVAAVADAVAAAVPVGLDCAAGLAAGFERYATLHDTAPGRTYRDGVSVDDAAQDCAIQPGASGVWDNVFVFSTAHLGSPSQTAVTFPSDLQLGRMDGCAEGGGVRIYAAGSVHAPAKLNVTGAQFVLLGNAHFAAKAAGVGLMVEAAGDIEMAAQAELGGCSPDERDRASDVVVTIRPISIVN